jgi:hypothetical protein
MRYLLFQTLCLAVLIVSAQRQVSEEAIVKGQDELILDFEIADEIKIITWNEQKVKVEVSVSINDGEHDALFEIEQRSNERTIAFKHDKNMFQNRELKGRRCSESEIFYTVYMPENMTLDINTISSDIVLIGLTDRAFLKTISGDIDITVSDGLEFKAKTISGEVYSDLDIDYPDGTNGLKQIVGMNIKGIIGNGSELYSLETISGSIFLRKG